MLLEFDPPLPNLYQMKDGTSPLQFRLSMPGAPQVMTGALTMSKQGTDLEHIIRAAATVVRFASFVDGELD
jgi:hypothetical protein